jgi:hypothetical protein
MIKEDCFIIPACILCHWQPRSDCLEDATEKIRETLYMLGKIDGSLKTWVVDNSCLGSSKSEMSTLLMSDSDFDDSYKLIADTLLLSRRCEDENRDWDHNIGFTFGTVTEVKNDLVGTESSLLIRCCTKGSKRNLNLLSLQLPRYGTDAERMNNIDLQIKIVRTIVGIWNPEWISVRDDNNVSYNPWKFGAFLLGWINYISDSVAEINELPNGWHWKYADGIRLFCFNRGICPIDTSEDQNSFRSMVRVIQKVCPYPSCMKNEV